MIEQNAQVDKTFFKNSLEFLSMTSDAFICIVDENGKVIINSGEELDITIDKEFFKEIFDGEPFVKHIGSLGGVFNTTMLSVGQPLKADGKVIGTIFLSIAIPEIQQMRSDVFQIFLTIAFFVLPTNLPAPLPNLLAKPVVVTVPPALAT